VKTDCPQSFPSLRDPRVVTLQYPWEHETRVDAVLSRDIQRKRSVEMGFWESRGLAYRTYFELAFQT
jgi:hypothetical protein